MTVELYKNTCFERESKKFRLLEVNPKEGCGYVIELDHPALPERVAFDDLKAWANGPNPVKGIDDPAEQPRPSLPSPKDLRVGERRWERIKDLVNHPDIWDASTRRSLLLKHARTIGVSERCLREDLRAWWQGGQRRDALLGEYWKCGRITADGEGVHVIEESTPNGRVVVLFKDSKAKARGRNPVYGDHGKFAITAKERAAILEVAREHFLKDKSRSVRGAAVAVLDELYTVREEAGEPRRTDDGVVQLLPKGQRPSVDQVRYLIKKAFPGSKQFAHRSTTADFLNNHAPSTGSVLDDCRGVGDVYEIDSTVLDAYGVAKDNRAVILGKPTLYLVIDRDSRLIVGFYLTWEPPSWAGARMAILSVANDWEAVCKRLGVRYDPRDWPAVGIQPRRYFADLGDMVSEGSNLVCDGLDVEVTNARSLLSSDKPIVESGFICVHKPLREDAAGFEPAYNLKKRRAKKFHKDASMTLDEIAASILVSVIAHNRRELLGYPLHPSLVLAGASSSPLAIWKRGVEERMGALARLPVDYTRRKLLPTKAAKVHVDGIELDGLLYESKVGSIKEWHTRASLRGTFEVKARFNPALVDEIVVIDPVDGTKEHVLQLTSDCRAFQGYSSEEVRRVLQIDRRRKYEAKDINLALDVSVRHDLRDISSKAREDARNASRGMSADQRKVGGDLVRDEEARARRALDQSLTGEAGAYGLLDSDTAAQRSQTGIDEAQVDMPGSSSSNDTTAVSDPITDQATAQPAPAQRLSGFSLDDLDSLLPDA